MLKLTSEIKIGKYKFKNIHTVEITRSLRSIIDRCTIIIPRKVQFNKQNIHLGSSGMLRRGMAVTVKLGYDDQLTEVFSGVLKHVGAGFPVRLECEGAETALKLQQVKPRTFTSATLEDVIKYILPKGMTYQAVDVSLGEFRILTETTASQVINAIVSKYALPIFTRGSKIYAGTTAWEDIITTHELAFGHNIIDHKLKYIREEDLLIKVKAVSILKDSKKVEATVGDENGDVRTIHFYNVSDKKKLEAQARDILDELKYSGMQGTVTTFGEPFIQHGDAVKLTDTLDLIKEKEGTYRVEKVVTRFGIGHGYRQVISLGKKIG